MLVHQTEWMEQYACAGFESKSASGTDEPLRNNHQKQFNINQTFK
jgi:hypothetical protein